MSDFTPSVTLTLARYEELRTLAEMACDKKALVRAVLMEVVHDVRRATILHTDPEIEAVLRHLTDICRKLSRGEDL
jgi:hypothetical protein